jgi:hypothetical protein
MDLSFNEIQTGGGIIGVRASAGHQSHQLHARRQTRSE